MLYTAITAQLPLQFTLKLSSIILLQFERNHEEFMLTSGTRQGDSKRTTQTAIFLIHFEWHKFPQ